MPHEPAVKLTWYSDTHLSYGSWQQGRGNCPSVPLAHFRLEPRMVSQMSRVKSMHLGNVRLYDSVRVITC